MNRYRLNEDKKPSKLPVRFSYKIYQQIKNIENLNQNNAQQLSQWAEYLDGLKNYISNRAIAWNYSGRNIKLPNGTFFVRDLDYNIGYSIKTDETKKSLFVYVFMINLKPEEFDLKTPPTLKECKQSTIRHYSLTEFQLRKIIRESIRKYILMK